MSLLEITNLSLSIRDTEILSDVSLSIHPGEVVAVTGESGSGKSMTAMAIMQLLPDGSETSGAILLDGQDVTQLSETELCRLRGDVVGMVFQEPMTALNPVKTIGAQVAETVRLHRSDLDTNEPPRTCWRGSALAVFRPTATLTNFRVGSASAL